MPYIPPPATQIIPLRAAYSSQVWTSIPAALTEFNANTQGRIKYDLSPFSQARLVVKMMSTQGPTGSELRAQYSTDESSWSYLDNSAGPAASITTPNVTTAGSWVGIVAAARADVWLRVIGINGDGATSPSFGNFYIEVR